MMQIPPLGEPSHKPDKATKKGLGENGGLSFTTKLFEFALNDKAQACAFIFGVLLFLSYIGLNIVIIFNEISSTQSMILVLDRLWQGFLLCLGVMLGGQMKSKDD